MRYSESDYYSSESGGKMDIAGALLQTLDFVMHETALFAAAGFLALGLGDLVVDTVWIGLALARALARWRGGKPVTLDTLPPPQSSGLMAIFIPAWDEAAVIGDMLRNTLAAFDHGDYRLYVGCYPNDFATIDEVRAIADPRVRLVIGATPGPTTKADCLNQIWETMLADELAEGRLVKAIILHDAEDVVHPAELSIFDRLIEKYDLVQLPVRPLIHPVSPWVSGHYADEFAEAHAKELCVRQRLGAALPSAGVGCAFSREALMRMARQAGGQPFDASSLTEDYELGLKLRALGGAQIFARIVENDGDQPIATREYFPATIEDAVRQKSRWVTGIALSGWDRLGWAGGLAERWMRLRDRQSVLAAVLLCAGYVSFGLWFLLKLPEWLIGWETRSVSAALEAVLWINFAILLWRLAMRCYFTTQTYGWRQGLLSLPRIVVGNYITILAAWRAVACYRNIQKTGLTKWDKTAHVFPVKTIAR
jgi:adsorption protein B